MVRWADELSWQEFADLMKKTDIAIVPVGTIEQHGPHLPLGTDSFSASEIAKRLGERVEALLFPTIKVGHTFETFNTSTWPGTISISTDTMTRLYTEIGKELVRHGARRIIFVSPHYNNTSGLSMAAFKIWEDTGAAAGILEYFVAARKEIREYTEAVHADQLETSLMLCTEMAHLVKLEKAVANPGPVPPFDDEKTLWELGMFDKYTYTVDERYLFKGNLGDPRKFSKEGGEKVLQKTVDVGVVLIRALERHVNHDKIQSFRSRFERITY